MIGIVKLALRRPYTFIVMALLIMIFGVASALRTPTDIFPNINIPVVSVVFSYTGLPPDDMAGRIVTFYERSLTTSVNDIEHIESQSIPNYGIIKIFFQPTVNINAALAQVAAHVANGVEADAGRHHAAADPELQRLQRADPAARAVEQHALRDDAVRPGDAASSARNWPRSPVPPFRCPMAARSGRSRPTSTSRRCTPTASRRTTSSTPCRSRT